MAKRNIVKDTLDEMKPSGEAVSERTGVHACNAVPENPARSRRKFPVLLMEEFDTKEDPPQPRAMRRVQDSPNFETDADALKWAQDKNLSGVYHTITDRGTWRLETETVQKTSVKAVTP